MRDSRTFATPLTTQGSARPRDGAPTPVLGTLSLNPSHRISAGNVANTPSRGEFGRGPAALKRLDSGRVLCFSAVGCASAHPSPPTRRRTPPKTKPRQGGAMSENETGSPPSSGGSRNQNPLSLGPCDQLSQLATACEAGVLTLHFQSCYEGQLTTRKSPLPA